THARSSCSMAAAEIFDKLQQTCSRSPTPGWKNFSDRLNFEVTVILLLLTYVLSPVACYIRTRLEPTARQEQYVLTIIAGREGTFASPSPSFISTTASRTRSGVYRDRRIVYYQWVPFVRAGLQSLMFYLPRVLSGHDELQQAGGHGTSVTLFGRLTTTLWTADGEKHAKLVQHVCRRLEQLLFQHNKKHRCSSGPHGKLTTTERLRAVSADCCHRNAS
uniref:Innexin n=1 Tax=Macrostomum lignano TaxID=282301 RepID=A0A1I8FRB7_9PLAT